MCVLLWQCQIHGSYACRGGAEREGSCCDGGQVVVGSFGEAWWRAGSC